MTSIQMNERDQVALSNIADALRGKECPPPEQFLAHSWSTLNAAARLRIQNHIASCVVCQSERRLARAFDDEHALSAQVITFAGSVRLPGEESDAGQSRAALWRGLLAATVAACAVGLGSLVLRGDRTLPEVGQRNSELAVVRGAPITLLPQIVASDTGEVTVGWKGVGAHAAYRVTFRNAAQDVVWTAQTHTTRLALPESLANTGGRLRWDVVALDDHGEPVAQSAEGVYISSGGSVP